MVNGKAIIICLIAGLIKKHFYKRIDTFLNHINLLDVKVDLTNYATKADFKKATDIDTPKLAAKSDLATLRVKTHKIDVFKLEAVPIDLCELSNVKNNDVVKKSCV